MAADDLLREASDPTTPGERLRELLTDPRGETAPMAAGNPSLPLEWLATALDPTGDDHWWQSPEVAFAAWHNPSTPLLLVPSPMPEHREAAARALATMGLPTDRSLDLELLLDIWVGRARLATLGLVAPGIDVPAAIDFVRHLASLFSLPWPGDR